METGKIQEYEVSFKIQIDEDQNGAEEFALGMVGDALEHVKKVCSKCLEEGLPSNAVTDFSDICYRHNTELVSLEKIILISVEKVNDKANKN